MPSSLHEILPVEIIDLIIHCSSSTELYNLCLVDHTIGQLATSWLYHTIDASAIEWDRNGPAIPCPFPLGILVHKRLGPLIRNLYVPDLEFDYNDGIGDLRALLERHRSCLDSKYFAGSGRIPFFDYLWKDALGKMCNLRGLKLGGCDAFFNEMQDVPFKLESLCLFRCVTMKSDLETFLASQISLKNMYLQDIARDTVSKAPNVWRPAFSCINTEIEMPSLNVIGWQNSTPAEDVRAIVGKKRIQAIVVELTGFRSSEKQSLTPYISHIQPTTAGYVRTGVFLFHNQAPERQHLDEIVGYYSGLATLKIMIHPFNIKFLDDALAACRASKGIQHLVIEGSESTGDNKTKRESFRNEKNRVEHECKSLHFASFQMFGTPELRVESLEHSGSCIECRNLRQDRWQELPTFPTRSWFHCV